MPRRRPSYYRFLARVILLGLVVAGTAGVEQYLLRRNTPRHLVALATRRADDLPNVSESPEQVFDDLSRYETFKVLVSLTGTGVIVATAALLFAPLAKEFATAADRGSTEPLARVEPHQRFRQRVLDKRK